VPKNKYDSKAFQVYLDSDKVWEYIETGRNIDDLYPDSLKEELTVINESEVLKTMLVEGEQYSKLSNSFLSGYVLTSYGRIINTKHSSVSRLYYTKNTIYHMIRFCRIDTLAEMALNNYKTDMELIKSLHVKYSWKIYNDIWKTNQTK
jgi:hypothetical protein